MPSVLSGRVLSSALPAFVVAVGWRVSGPSDSRAGTVTRRVQVVREAAARARFGSKSGSVRCRPAERRGRARRACGELTARTAATGCERRPSDVHPRTVTTHVVFDTPAMPTHQRSFDRLSSAGIGARGRRSRLPHEAPVSSDYRPPRTRRRPATPTLRGSGGHRGSLGRR